MRPESVSNNYNHQYHAIEINSPTIEINRLAEAPPVNPQEIRIWFEENRTRLLEVGLQNFQEHLRNSLEIHPHQLTLVETLSHELMNARENEVSTSLEEKSGADEKASNSIETQLPPGQLKPQS